MRKTTLLFTIILTVFLWSCGGNSGEKQSSNKSEVTKDNTAFSKKDGMMQYLKEFDFDIPDGLVYKEIKPAVSNRYLGNMGYSVIYKIEDSEQEKLKSWFSEQFEKMIANGWEKDDYREDVEMMGSGDLYSTFSVLKSKENGNYYLLACHLNKDEISVSAGESNYELTRNQL